MSEIESGLFSINVDRMVNMLSKSYISLIETKTQFSKFPSVMLWGPPGVGKSQGVRQIAKSIEENTNKKVIITDVRLLLFNPVDLRGIPTANEDKSLAVWLKPKIFQMDEDEGIVNILFLDEISAAPPSVQASAYQITLDRMVGEHKLPDNCIVIAAGNRVTDKSVAYNMPKALANRLCHFEINCVWTKNKDKIKKFFRNGISQFKEFGGKINLNFTDESVANVIDLLTDKRVDDEIRTKMIENYKVLEEKSWREYEKYIGDLFYEEQESMHIESVTCMDLPMDWNNVFSTDPRASGVVADTPADGLILSFIGESCRKNVWIARGVIEYEYEYIGMGRKIKSGKRYKEI